MIALVEGINRLFGAGAGAWRGNLLGVHARLDDLERHAPPHRLGLLGDIHHTATAFADA